MFFQLIFDQRLSSKVCDDCVNDLFNADLLRDMLLKCNAPLKTEMPEETEGEVIEMYEEIPIQESIQESVQYEEDFKVPQSPIKIQFQCHKCSTAFLSMGLLIRHLAKEHSGRKALVFKQQKSVPPKANDKESRYVCHRCNIPVQKLGPHMSSVHPNDPLEFKCKFCGRIFSKLSVLQKHMFDHHLPMHICEECGATFKRKARLIDHKVSYHLKLKAFVCHYCDAKFARKPGLKAHIRTHTGSKPYKCKYCDKVRTLAHFEFNERVNHSSFSGLLALLGLQNTRYVSHRRMETPLSHL